MLLNYARKIYDFVCLPSALDLNIEVNVEQPRPRVLPVPMPGYLRGKTWIYKLVHYNPFLTLLLELKEPYLP